MIRKIKFPLVMIVFGLLSITLFSCGNKEKQEENQVIKSNNAVIENILTRRAIRKYTEKQVPKNLIDSIMKCAVYAPSALNKQPWEVRVIQNQALLKKYNETFVNDAKGKQLEGSAAKSQMPGFSVFHDAPTLIVIARDTENPFSSFDCGLLSQNILLSAHAYGLGTCPIGGLVSTLNNPDHKDLVDPLQFSEKYQVEITIALGYPNEKPPVKKRIAEKVKIIE